METLRGQDIDKLTALARTSLIRARIAKQKAKILEDFLLVTRPANVVRQKLEEYRQDARFDRKEAREILIVIDLWNSKRYMNGQTYLGLCHTLNGREFRDWNEYRTLYEMEPLFQGVDPC